MPTLLDIAGADYPKQYKGEKVHSLVGTSMLPLFKGKAIHRKNPLYFDWRRGSAIRTDHWKLVREGKTWELYDMRKDRTETHNLAEDKPKLVRQLRTQWERWAKQVGIQ